MKAVIITAVRPDMPRPCIDDDTILVAVDGGGDYCLKHRLSPRVVIGDFDSCSPAVKSIYADRLLPYPQEKDASDTELAIEWCHNNGVTEATIFNHLGGRLDHLWGMSANLELAARQGIIATLVSDRYQIHLLSRGAHTVNLKPGAGLGLVPVSKKVEVAKLTGTQYTLENQILYRWSTRGISNRVTDTPVVLEIARGKLLLMAEL